jgi:hypothetical protein
MTNFQSSFELRRCSCQWGDGMLPKVVLERLTIMLRIWKVPSSNIGQETGYHRLDFRGFLQPLQTNAGRVF